MGLKIFTEKCIGCSICVKACPFGALEVVDKKVIVNSSCTLCGICVDVCKFQALEKPEREPFQVSSLADHRGVWVFIQRDNGGIHHVSLELIGEGRKLADEIGTEVACMVLGDDNSAIIEELSAYPVDKVFSLENPVLANYRTQAYVEASSSMIKDHKPEIVLIGATSTGRDFAGGLATELMCGLTADCTGLAIEKETKSLLQTRPAFGGNIMATIKSANHRPQMATVRPKVFPMPLKGDKKKLDVVVCSNNLAEDVQKSKVLEWTPIKEKVNLADANVIVSGGRGMGRKENLSLLAELAELLGGAVGASRAVVDAEWIDYSHQVGQTGRTVRPNVYLACGISGAVQHLAGMKTSDTIIAINRDKSAPIFGVATYGFVGDALEILPKVVTELKKRLGKE